MLPAKDHRRAEAAAAAAPRGIVPRQKDCRLDCAHRPGGELQDTRPHSPQPTGADATVEKVTDTLAIAEYGVFGTPAVVVDGEVKSVGKIPKKEEVIGWIG